MRQIVQRFTRDKRALLRNDGVTKATYSAPEVEEDQEEQPAKES